jgi:hypothetical protein
VRDHTTAHWLSLLDRAGFDAKVVYIWTIFIEFASWVVRMRTPPQRVAMLRTLLTDAPQEVKTELQIQPDGSFTVQGALFVGTPKRM